jgi:hypothetical protein
MQSHLKTGLIEIETVVDEDGLVLQKHTKQNNYLASSKEEFFLCYTSMLGVIIDMTVAEIKTFSYLLERYADGTKFDISKNIRLDIERVTGLKERSIYNIIPKIEAKKAIIRVEDTGLHVINPRYAFRGSSLDRNKQLKFVLEWYDKDA